MNKVLIVEDNEMNRDILTRRLQRKGFDTEIAINGEEALSQAKLFKPDIILMDMSLPVMDGWEATRLLKNQDETRHIPVIGLSAHAREADLIRGKEAGCDAYETKPVDLDLLINTIQSLLSDK
ncbi:MAG: response regulator [Gammaproteobacteria bacterium]|nr:response regulator [Gammaproteobacteria bacterium]